MLQVHAPRLDATECRDQRELEFLNRLQLRAESANWRGTAWGHETLLVIGVDVSDNECNCVVRSLRVDFNGERVLCGDDETSQYVTDLSPDGPGVATYERQSPATLADLAADWLERELARKIVRQEWNKWRFKRRVWLFADTGQKIMFSDSANKRDRLFVGEPDRSVVIEGKISSDPG